MNWPLIFTGISTLTAAVLGFLAFRRGSKADEALNLGTSIKTTLESQQGFMSILQAQIQSQQAHIKKLEEDNDALRSANTTLREDNQRLHDEIDEMKEAMAGMQTVIKDLQRKSHDE